jgi:hypothetical protein
MGRKGVRFLEEISVFIIETTNTWPENEAGR